ncbi:hypothetical protein BJ684DRAFT_17210 [Piptocephalis cylindrospora]|uniref:Uncharacterized protein n=1 Tax=Piptocephalis cylindrospora TaxID=1907219 RepID=A0A4P9Y0M3_9FUNG|nr:hypothetical protein BJ684DRAFT_17210 [Piptocephalis cylindrospora]|eukprot:RKP12288.1 hypothetical protein BJ684DRAFT_17210 [Piptocephalis cylindrospora]
MTLEKTATISSPIGSTLLHPLTHQVEVVPPPLPRPLDALLIHERMSKVPRVGFTEHVEGGSSFYKRTPPTTAIRNRRGDEDKARNDGVTTETLDDFLSHFTFEEGRVLPTGCLNLHQVVHGCPKGTEDIPPRLLLETNNALSDPEVEVHIDIDSVLWNLQDLPLIEPIMVYPNPPRTMNVTGSHQYVQCPGYTTPAPLEKVPHCLFGKDYLSESLLNDWYDKVVYPALAQSLSRGSLQHFCPSRQNFKDTKPGNLMGHLLQSEYALQVTQAMRRIVTDEESLRSRFGGFFFHAACKGTKQSTTISLVDLMDPAKYTLWKENIDRMYLGTFGEEGKSRMQVDLGAEFIPSDSTVRDHGHIHMSWKKDSTEKMRMGTGLAPRLYEWWLAQDVAGSVASLRAKNVLGPSMEPPSVSYFQTYHLDKELIPGGGDRWVNAVDGAHMRWDDQKLKESWEMILRGVEHGSVVTSGARMEARIAGRHLDDSVDPLGFFKVCHGMQQHAHEHFRFLPSLAAARFKAANLWVIREGAKNVTRMQKADNATGGSQRREFMEILASLFRGFSRGMAFTTNRSKIFGPMLVTKEGSYGLGLAIMRYNHPYLPQDKIDWENARACIAGFQSRKRVERLIALKEQLTVGNLSALIDWAIPGEAQEELGTVEDVARCLMRLLKEDMVEETVNFQTAASISTWNLEEVRLAIPYRQERHISNRRDLDTWRKIFCYMFPLLDAHSTNEYIHPYSWRKVTYLSTYLAYQGLIHTHQLVLPPDTLLALRQAIWTSFKDMNCIVRSSTQQKFVKRVRGYVCIDLRDRDDML